jgi:hypothetical protein
MLEFQCADHVPCGGDAGGPVRDTGISVCGPRAMWRRHWRSSTRHWNFSVRTTCHVKATLAVQYATLAVQYATLEFQCADHVPCGRETGGPALPRQATWTPHRTFGERFMCRVGVAPKAQRRCHVPREPDGGASTSRPPATSAPRRAECVRSGSATKAKRRRLSRTRGPAPRTRAWRLARLYARITHPPRCCEGRRR